ncbi:ATP synthase F1 subunit gamma [Clostridiisalibacter paucivorans]|uniref:ATP synthase F1 subunit gamma n=1 Tax=Clostridiisalibacter paucivorans TaxID=408753 RepID=UPI00047D4A81|nr:ATP synthase F1 subunit gamma [Clostridiisalibacter paucivorans]
MAQSGIRDIKRRIKSIGNTRQITKAMELVSSAKLNKYKSRLEKTRPYFDTVVESIQDILASTTGIRHPLLEKREVKKTCYLVITSDRGLCGGYNSNITRMVDNKIDNKENVAIMVTGQKGRDFFKRKDYNIEKDIIGISEDPQYSQAIELGNIVTELYENGEVDEVNLVYTRFISTISHEPTIMKLLPAEKITGENSNEENKKRALIEYEPSAEEVLSYLIPKYIQSSIYGALVESSVSEQGARRVAMENATDNADEMVQKLNLKYNRARQAAITQEISEIVGGAEALK